MKKKVEKVRKKEKGISNINTNRKEINELEKDFIYKEEIELLKKQLSDEKENYLRLYADFDNYKKRTSKERIDIFSSANIDTISSILPVLDDIDIFKNKTECTDDNKGFFLIVEKLVNIVKTKGLEEINVNKGDVFDVDLHEGITTINIEDENMDGKIYDIISKGYKLNGKVIRYAKVVIGQKNDVK